MRYLAEVEGKQRAESLVAWLITKSIDTHIEPAPSKEQLWEIWIRDEDKLVEAKQELLAFQANPEDPKYLAAVDTARQIIKDKQIAAQNATKNQRPVKYSNPTGRSQLMSGPLPPLTLTLIISCIVISLLSNFTSPDNNSKLGQQIVDKMLFVSDRAYQASQDPAVNIKRGELWRVITPIFLHADPLHLFMNMLALVAFGRLTERLVGTPRFSLMILVLGIIPIMLACLMPLKLDGSPFTVGISGVVYGLAGYLWLVSSQRPDLGFRIPDGLIIFMLVIIVAGFAGMLPGISNWAHLGGFLVGLGLALMEKRL